MTQEEKDIFKAAIEAAKLQGSTSWTAIANTMTNLVEAFERTGKKSRFAKVENAKENPLTHLVKKETISNVKRVSLKEAAEKNILANSETKAPTKRKK